MAAHRFAGPIGAPMDQRHTPTSLSEVWAKPNEGAGYLLTRRSMPDRPANPILHISIRALAPTRRNGGTRHENLRSASSSSCRGCAHVHGCVVTQMNWSPSPAWTVARERELRAAFEAVLVDLSDDTIGGSSFGKVDFELFVRHARIDVLGLRLDRDFWRH